MIYINEDINDDEKQPCLRRNDNFILYRSNRIMLMLILKLIQSNKDNEIAKLMKY